MIESGTRFQVRAFSALCCAAFIGGLVGGILVAPAPAAAAALRLTYRVTHSVYGDIGTYSNTIQSAADSTTVQTWANFQVRMLGMRLYHEEAQRTEHWQGNRLVSFHSVTTKNGDQPVVVDGAARGDSFVVTTPHGRVRAPADIRPANPWSAKFLGSHTMMRPDDGKIEQVRVSRGQPTTVKVDGQEIAATEYKVTGQTTYRVWLDRRGVPVKFTADDDSGVVTFTLTNCGDCQLALSYLGGNP